jgi:hypothetical protein
MSVSISGGPGAKPGEAANFRRGGQASTKNKHLSHAECNCRVQTFYERHLEQDDCEEPAIESIAIANGAASIKFETEPGLSYTLDFNQTLGSPNTWQTVQTVVGDGAEHTLTQQLNSNQGFYRLRLGE